MNPFGYHYPPGAENDQNAPWNERGEYREQIRQQWQEDKADIQRDNE